MACCGLWWIAADYPSFSASLKDVLIPFHNKALCNTSGEQVTKIESPHDHSRMFSCMKKKNFTNKPFTKGRKGLDMCWEIKVNSGQVPGSPQLVDSCSVFSSINVRFHLIEFGMDLVKSCAEWYKAAVAVTYLVPKVLESGYCVS